MKKIVLCLFFLLLTACSKKEPISIAYDPNWFGVDLGSSEENLNGFIEDFLLAYSRDKGKEIYKMEVNWDSLERGLLEGKYQAIISSIYPYSFEKAKFDFSTLLFPTGPVLVHQNMKKSHYGINLGVREGDNAQPAVDKMPDAHLYTYENYPKLLEALQKGDINYAVMPYITAVNYLSSTFYGKFEMEMPPLTDRGIRILVRKGTEVYVLYSFDALIKKMQKRSDYTAMLKKWDLFVE